MKLSTLPRHALAPGWAHPYARGPFSPYWYADGDPDPAGDPAGGDPDPTDDPDPDDPEGDPDDDPEGADDLGDKGKQALDRMKARLKAERDRRKAAETERDQLKAAKPKDGDPDPDDVRKQAEQAATAKANQRIVRSEVRAAAVGKLANPKDALVFLDLTQFEVDEDGGVDEDEVAEAIDDLLKERPYLAAQGGRRFQGGGDGGARNRSGAPTQVTEDELDKMTPDQIDKARKEGRLDDLLGVKR